MNGVFSSNIVSVSGVIFEKYFKPSALDKLTVAEIILPVDLVHF